MHINKKKKKTRKKEKNKKKEKKLNILPVEQKETHIDTDTPCKGC